LYFAIKSINDSRNLVRRNVPFFVFDQAYAVSGAQGEESFLHVLNTVAEKTKQ